jgi:hypothetical protein
MGRLPPFCQALRRLTIVRASVESHTAAKCQKTKSSSRIVCLALLHRIYAQRHENKYFSPLNKLIRLSSLSVVLFRKKNTFQTTCQGMQYVKIWRKNRVKLRQHSCDHNHNTSLGIT